MKFIELKSFGNGITYHSNIRYITSISECAGGIRVFLSSGESIRVRGTVKEMKDKIKSIENSNE